MLDTLQFVFSSWWTYFGTILLLSVVGGSVNFALQPFRRSTVNVNNFPESREADDE